MKNISMRFCRIFFVVLLLTACTDKKTAQTILPVDSLFKEYYAFKMRVNPIESTKAGESKYNDRVENYISDPYLKDLIANYSSFLTTIGRYDSTMVTPSQWISLGVMKWDCKIKLEGLRDSLVTIASPMFDMPSFELTPIMQIQSLHLYMSQLAGGTSIQPFRTVVDYDNWLKRIDDFLPFLDTAMAKMNEGIRRNVVLPKVVIVKMIPQIRDFVKLPAEQHLYYTPIRMMPEDFSAEDKERLTAAYDDMITTRLVPKYQQLLEYLTKIYLPAGRNTHGISAVPHGRKAFNHLIKYFTTTGLTAEQIHLLGKSEVDRISAEMEKVKSEVGFKGDMKAFFDHVRTSKDQMPFTKPEEVIANFNSIHERIKQKLGDVFDLKPKGGFEVRRTESFREASASAEFLPGNKDGSRPGIFYVPIPDVKSYNKFADEALFLHEAIPGHYYQLTLQQENDELPEFLHPESISVFVEGWGLYAESLGKELGLYEDPYQYFGMLSMEMHRAIRLVLETGIHTMGWTREQAIQYSLDHEAEPLEKIIVEVERYIATPGAALCYKIGQLKIRELRTRAEQSLGDKFSVKEFHNQVLNSGSLPLILLEKKINGWIAEQKLK
ncbi:MAG TPA: DUF885 domain-containing protein [Cyclobacteriaceae bacterium]|nr:DUF885 domain-containing protein [Cyclobacteriaceae bacterium]